MKSLISSKRLLYSLGFMAVLVTAAFAIVEMGFIPGPNTDSDADADAPAWPALVMTYDTTGKFFVIGDNEAELTTKTRRLEYLSVAAWTATVTAAPDMVTRYGTYSDVGSYHQIADGVHTAYDAVADETTTVTLSDDKTMVPGGSLVPLPLANLREAVDSNPTKVTTVATVCFDAVCDANAEGWAFDEGDGITAVYADDARGIPLRIGNLVVTDLRVQGAKEPVHDLVK